MTAAARAVGCLRAGAANVLITPPVGIAMQGYDLRYAERIHDHLFASALAVADSNVAWLLICVDVIGLDRAFALRVREKLASRLQLKPSAVTVVCSHTHSGPATVRCLGPVACDTVYLGVLEEKLISVAIKAAERLEPVRWRFGVASLAENVNRRKRKFRRVELAADFRGPVDHRLRVLRMDRVADAHQQPLALLVHYACHPTLSSGVPEISADWPGTMRAVLQRAYAGQGEEPVICFTQGCTGDLTHRLARDRDRWPQHTGLQTSLQSEILGRLAASAALSASEYAVEFCAERIDAAVEILDLPFRDLSESEATEVQVIRVGPSSEQCDKPSVWIIGLPGEPFTEYSTGLGQLFDRRLGVPSDKVLVCGYSNDCIGYLCTSQALRQGGYEADVAHQMYHRPASFAATTQSIVFDQVLTAAAKLLDSSPRQRPTLFTTTPKFLRRWRGLRV